jgi:hypothetical protein
MRIDRHNWSCSRFRFSWRAIDRGRWDGMSRRMRGPGVSERVEDVSRSTGGRVCRGNWRCCQAVVQRDQDVGIVK